MGALLEKVAKKWHFLEPKYLSDAMTYERNKYDSVLFEENDRKRVGDTRREEKSEIAKEWHFEEIKIQTRKRRIGD